MKKHILILICTILLMSSCEDLLEENAYGTFSNENYFQSEEDALTATLYAYDPLNYIEFGSRFLFDLADLTTDEMNSYGRSEVSHRLEMMNWSFTPSSDVLTYFFKYGYMIISRSNSVIQNVSEMSNISEEKRNQFIGEARFLRAFSYFYLVRSFGDIPLRTETVDDINSVSSSYSDIQSTYGFIIDDLEKAIGLLPIRKMQGRADRVAAQSLLAKVYATMASSALTGSPGYDWVGDHEVMYEKAAEYAGAVLYDQGVYGMEEDLLDIYDVENFANSPEHIFISSMNRDASGEEGNWSQLPQMFVISLPEVYVSSSLSGSGSDTQLMVNSQTWGVYRTDSLFYRSFSDEDLRKRLMVTEIYTPDGSLLAEWSPSNITSTNSVENSFYYPFTRKYSDPLSSGTTTSANVYFLRFTDVALIYAEAMGNTAEGYQWINNVRARAALAPLDENLGLQEFREAVWTERKYELSMEGHRLFDLRRTNKVEETITNKQINSDYAYFFPIPQREVELN
ncbi:MAG: RagB/SusD family nutrient uptake outer membrane protein [Algicola sp.]|nr:RagB/SusD family nutrient uptake outer membrane protein [Algicola sp.]